MPFVRVKSARESDPQHEFDVSVVEFEANSELYALVDDVVADDSRPPLYVSPPGVEPESEPEPAPKKRK